MSVGGGIVQSAKGTLHGLTHLPKRFPVLGKLLPHTGKTPYNKEKTASQGQMTLDGRISFERWNCLWNWLCVL